MKGLFVLFVLALALTLTSCASSGYRNDRDDYYYYGGRMSMDRARELVFDRYPDARIRDQRYQQLGGRYIYGFDVWQPETPGYEAVILDPYNGNFLYTGYERHRGDWRRQQNWSWSDQGYYNRDRDDRTRDRDDRNRDRDDRNRDNDDHNGDDSH